MRFGSRRMSQEVISLSATMISYLLSEKVGQQLLYRTLWLLSHQGTGPEDRMDFLQQGARPFEDHPDGNSLPPLPAFLEGPNFVLRVVARLLLHLVNPSLEPLIGVDPVKGDAWLQLLQQGETPVAEGLLVEAGQMLLHAGEAPAHPGAV